MSAPPQLGEDLSVPSGKSQVAFVRPLFLLVVIVLSPLDFFLPTDLTAHSRRSLQVVRGIDDVGFEERPLPADPGPDE